MMNEIVVLILSYLIGSIPFGLILTKIAGYGDIRKIGSGNIGATNVMRTGNKSLAILTLFCDAVKAYLAIKFAIYFNVAESYASVFAILGHIFPIWTKFKGGKGVASYLGALWELSIFAAFLFIISWLVSFVVTRISSLSSLLAIFSVVVMSFFSSDKEIFIAITIMAIIITIKHQDNIMRLIKGKELKFLKEK